MIFQIVGEAEIAIEAVGKRQPQSSDDIYRRFEAIIRSLREEE